MTELWRSLIRAFRLTLSIWCLRIRNARVLSWIFSWSALYLGNTVMVSQLLPLTSHSLGRTRRRVPGKHISLGCFYLGMFLPKMGKWFILLRTRTKMISFGTNLHSCVIMVLWQLEVIFPFLTHCQSITSFMVRFLQLKLVEVVLCMRFLKVCVILILIGQSQMIPHVHLWGIPWIFMFFLQMSKTQNVVDIFVTGRGPLRLLVVQNHVGATQCLHALQVLFWFMESL